MPFCFSKVETAPSAECNGKLWEPWPRGADEISPSGAQLFTGDPVYQMDVTGPLTIEDDPHVSGLPLLHSAGKTIVQHIKDGRFQRSLALITAGSSLVSGLEVAYEHYKGSYSNPVMYTPVILSGVLSLTSLGAVFSETIARGAMRWTCIVTLADGVIGFGFHLRGIKRKPGGWKLPITNIIMGPPVFAPLLFGTAAYLGWMASYLRREGDAPSHEVSTTPHEGWRKEIHEGRFQRHLAGVAAVWTVLSGMEAWYSHYKSRFRIWAQWTPVALAPLQLAACVGAIFSGRVARKVLPVTSSLATVDGAIGFFYHARGIMRRPGGRKTWLYNILYGPPIFAPLLFAACGALGALAALLRREDHE